MHSSLSGTLLFATTALSAALIPRQTSYPASSVFRVNSLLKNATDVSAPGASLGYLQSTFWYGGVYHAILNTDTAWTLSRAYVTDVSNRTDSRLVFPDEDYEHAMGFVLDPLSKETPSGFAVINADVKGTEGVYIDGKGQIQSKAPDGCKLHWFGCPGRQLGTTVATSLGYRLSNATTPGGCYDVDLLVEYM